MVSIIKKMIILQNPNKVILFNTIDQGNKKLTSKSKIKNKIATK